MPTFAGMEQRDKFKGVESIKFYSRFTDDASCLEYLSSIKWADGFKCKKCGHTNYCNDRYPYSRRCTRCKYDESVTSGSMFDKIKFPLVYAFHIAFKISTKKKWMSSLELAEEYCMRQKTVWEFKRKIQKACGAAVIILLKERYMSMSFISEEKRKESLDEARKAKRSL